MSTRSEKINTQSSRTDEAKRATDQVDRRYAKFSLTDDELIAFTRNILRYIDVGQTLVQAVVRLENTYERNALFREILAKIKTDLKNGFSFSTAISKYPRLFDRNYCQFVRAAEQSADFVGVFGNIIRYLERKNRFKKAIRSGLKYPAIIGVVLIVAVVVIASFVVPALRELFDQIVPESQRSFSLKVFYVIGELTHYWYLIVIVAAGVIVAVVSYFRTAEGKALLARWELQIPHIRDIFTKIYIGEFFSLFGYQFKSGVPSQAALEMCADTARNPIIQAALKRAYTSFINGVSLSTAIRDCHPTLFKGDVYSTLVSAEETGRLDTALIQHADHLFEDVERELEDVKKLIEPAVLCVAGVFVGFFLYTIYGAMFDIIGKLAKF